MRFGLGWTEISSYLPTLVSKEIGTIFSVLQPSPPWFPYSTSIVWHVSRRLRVLSLAFGLAASQTTESALSSTTTLSVSASLAAGSVADAAEVRKIAKYALLGRRLVFQPVAVETSGAMGKSTIQFFKDLGRRLAVRFQDQRESYFLFQRVSLAILRGNAFSILQSYRD